MALPGNNTDTDITGPYPPDSTLGVKHPELNSNSSASLRTYEESDKPKGEHEPLTREISRTPSPTPSEVESLNPDYKKRIIQFFNPKNWRRYKFYWLAIVLTIVLTILISVFHEKIVRGLEPAAVWLRDGSKVGWLVPIAILIIISFPPLFGQEIVAALCGLVWGTWIGFGIVAAGTFFGEVANFYAFRYMCRSRADKIEKKKIFYACLARVIRDGGFWIALVARYSAIPGHFTTVIFATCGMGIVVFSAAAILSLPKQFVNVYLGVLMAESVKNGGTSVKSRVVTVIAFIVTFLVTSFAMHYLMKKVAMIKPQVIYERRKARQYKTDTIYSKEALSTKYKSVGHIANVYKVAIPPMGQSYKQVDPHRASVDETFDHNLITPKPLLQQPTPTFSLSPGPKFSSTYYDPYKGYAQEDVEMGYTSSSSDGPSTGSHSTSGPNKPPGLSKPEGYGTE